MGNKNKPTAKSVEHVQKHDKHFPSKHFTDAKRKQEESDDHTVGGF